MVIEPGLKVQIFTDFERLVSVRTEWDDFVEDVCGDIFMTYDWCRLWWKYYGKNRNLRVYVFRSYDKLVGIVPLFFEEICFGPVSVRSVKIVGSDFTLTQFSLPIKELFLSEVVEALADNLEKINWDIIHIGPIAGKYNSFDNLKNSLSLSFSSCAEVQCKEKQVQTYFEMKNDWQAHLLSLSKNARRNIKRNYNELSKIGLGKDELVSYCASSEECLEAFDGFVEMHQQHWNNLGKLGHFGDWPKSYEFHKEMASSQSEHGRLRMMVTKCGNDTLGYEYAYGFGKKYYAILNSRLEPGALKRVSLGISMACEQVKMAIEEGVGCIDAMRGHYEYKLRLGGKLYQIHSIYVIRKGCFRKIKIKVFRLLCSFYNFFYYKIWFGRIAPRLQKKHKPLSVLWIRTHAFSR